VSVLLADCWGAHSVAELRAAGFDGVCCYLSLSDGQWGSKDAPPSQIAVYRSAGLYVLLNWEQGSTDAAGGYQQGIAYGNKAVLLAKARNYPAGCAIVFSNDNNTVPMADVLDYFRGVNAAVAGSGYVVGVYGNASTLDAVFAAGLAVFGWQTAAWSGGARSVHASLYQDGFGQTFDTNVLLVGSAPIWGLEQTPPAPKPPTPPKTNPPPPPAPSPLEEDDMFVVAEGPTVGHAPHQVVAGQYWILSGGHRILAGENADSLGAKQAFAILGEAKPYNTEAISRWPHT